MTQKINVNHFVRVKLSQSGKEILLREGYKLPNEDENGYSRWQLWELMQTFGAYIGMGMELPFEVDMEIEAGIEMSDLEADGVITVYEINTGKVVATYEGMELHRTVLSLRSKETLLEHFAQPAVCKKCGAWYAKGYVCFSCGCDNEEG